MEINNENNEKQSRQPTIDVIATLNHPSMTKQEHNSQAEESTIGKSRTNSYVARNNHFYQHCIESIGRERAARKWGYSFGNHILQAAPNILTQCFSVLTMKSNNTVYIDQSKF
ncbi:hypothetical protein V8G54_004899 [Vigna mungo]|uniref:Uncharacterized protein n=1 Tax=Vigna mungo TaxID=3915 RepID=A0AAQ3PD48_VIGMU